MSKFIAFITAVLTALTARFKRAVTSTDPYEGYEPTPEDLFYACPWDCGECRYCKTGREPDLG